MVEESEKNLEQRFFERQLVVFKLNQEEFGVDISDVREIIKLEEITQIPDMPSYVEGIINLRGKIVVIIDLSRKLGITCSEKSMTTRVIVTEIGNNTIGFIVDECNEVMRLTGDKIEEAPKIITEKINSDFIQGVGVLDSRLIIMIDLGRMIQNEDLSTLKGIDIPVPEKQEESKNKKKIMIVEDSTMMRGTLKSYIDQKKYEIIEAKDGEEGIKLIDQKTPDLVLLDIKLPKTNGIDVLKKIKEDYPEIPVVMETSVYDDNTKDQCIGLGAKAYLKKPISKDQIEEVLTYIR